MINTTTKERRNDGNVSILRVSSWSHWDCFYFVVALLKLPEVDKKIRQLDLLKNKYDKSKGQTRLQLKVEWYNSVKSIAAEIRQLRHKKGKCGNNVSFFVVSCSNEK